MSRIAGRPPCRPLRRSLARRSRDSSLAKARSNAAKRSSAAASARTDGPRQVMVSSTHSLRPDWRGLRSLDTSTSILIALLSSFSILASFPVACLRKRSCTSVCRPLKMMSIEEPLLPGIEAAPARPTWSSSPHPPAERFAALCHYCPSPYPGDARSPGEAGLTSKPHRDQSTRSRLTWAVSPAAGIGLPRPAPPLGGSLRGATTDPGGCHDKDASPETARCQVRRGAAQPG